MWPVDHRSDCLIETLEFCIPNHANDLTRIVLIFHGDDQSLAKRILVCEVLSRQGLINDYYPRFLHNFAIAEGTSFEQRNAERAEIILIDNADIGGRPVRTGHWRLAFNFETGSSAHARKGRRAGGSGCAHAGQ